MGVGAPKQEVSVEGKIGGIQPSVQCWHGKGQVPAAYHDSVSLWDNGCLVGACLYSPHTRQALVSYYPIKERHGQKSEPLYPVRQAGGDKLPALVPVLQKPLASLGLG